MAKKRGSNRPSRQVKRDTTHIASLPPRLLYRPLVIRSPLLPIQDHRSFQTMPKDLRPQRKIDASPAYTKNVVTWTRPWHMPRVEKQFHFGAVVCVRRKQRREIIFAAGQGGKRGKRPKYHRGSNSEFICRRK